MSIRRQQPQNRRNRRQRSGPSRSGAVRGLDLPGPLRFLTHPGLFLAIGLLFAGAIVFSLVAGAFGLSTLGNNSHNPNEAPDVARDVPPTSTASDTVSDADSLVKRYDAAPEFAIDVGKSYIATIRTTKGEIQIELFPEAAPDAVNTFVFLARDGYYNDTPFMQLVTNSDGTRFTAQAGDPTGTGLGTPGFEVSDEVTDLPFVRGAVGMAAGQFFISYGDYPTLSGKHTIFGQVVSGLEVLDELLLLDVNSPDPGSGDAIESVTITES